jgi:beta-glucosidase
VPAVIAAWFPGVQAGPALVRTIFGESNPSGKLSVSWPRSVGQEPLYYNALSTGRPAGNFDLTRSATGGGDDKYVSRYIDEMNSPQFPFGFGLSYTTFSVSAPSLDKSKLSSKTLNEVIGASRADQKPALTVTAEVKNTGSVAGKETVQIYIGLRGTSVSLPMRSLVGFEQVSLAPGETRKVSFSLPASAFAFWTDQNKFAAEPAEATIWVGANSNAAAKATLELTK